jgi:hypothetical protein
MLKRILDAVQGKKTTLVALTALLFSYLAFKGFIGNDELLLFNSTLAILGFGANVATSRYASPPTDTPALENSL